MKEGKGYDLSSTLWTKALKEVYLKCRWFQIGFSFKGKREYRPRIETKKWRYHSLVMITGYTPTNLRILDSTANRKQSNDRWIESPNSYPQHSTVIYFVLPIQDCYSWPILAFFLFKEETKGLLNRIHLVSQEGESGDQFQQTNDLHSLHSVSNSCFHSNSK